MRPVKSRHLIVQGTGVGDGQDDRRRRWKGFGKAKGYDGGLHVDIDLKDEWQQHE